MADEQSNQESAPSPHGVSGRGRSTGDTIIAEIGEGARGVVIGKNVVQVGTLSIPWWVIGLVMLVLVAILGVLVYQPVVAWVNPSTMNPEKFNIAVTALRVLDETGAPLEEQVGEEQAQSIADFIAGQREALREIINIDVDVWGPRQARRIVRTVTPGQEEAALDALNANVLIYGDLTRNGSSWTLIPRFYLDDAAVQAAAELQGPYALGRPLAYRPDNVAIKGETNEVLRARTEALVQLLKGLSFYIVQDEAHYARAREAFLAAAQDPDWGAKEDGTGQEILYHFLGNATQKLAFFADDTSPERTQWLEEARSAYDHAVELNPDFARSYVGLGVVQFQQAHLQQTDAEPCTLDWALLDAAEASYAAAVDAPAIFKPRASNVDIHALEGFGRINFDRGLCQSKQYWNLAALQLQRVVDAYLSLPLENRYLLGNPALVAFTLLGDMEYIQARFYLRNAPEKADEAFMRLERAIDYYLEANRVADALDTAEAQQHQRSLLPRVLDAHCLADRPAEAAALLDEYLGAAQGEAARAAILAEMEEDCIS